MASFSDNFARANENPLSDGGAWTSVSSNGFTGLKLSGNRAIGSTPSANNASIVTTPAFSANHSAAITRNAFDDAAIGPLCRFSTAATGYRLDLSGGGTQLTVYKIVAGSIDSALGSAFSVSTGGGDVIKMTVTGTTTVTLEVFVNNVSQGTRTDSSSPITTGSPGAFSNGNNTFDAFSAADLSSGYTLNASGGIFTLTGNSANLSASRVINAGAGSFALTGNAANLKASRNINAGAGTFALTGNSATLGAARKLNASGGTFALTGKDATLTYTNTPAPIPQPAPNAIAAIMVEEYHEAKPRKKKKKKPAAPIDDVAVFTVLKGNVVPQVRFVPAAGPIWTPEQDEEDIAAIMELLANR